MPTLYVIRHGEPAIRGVLLGRSDPPLSPRGRDQMASIRFNVRAAYSSPLRRAHESATLMGLRPVILPDLVEIGLGTWDGRHWNDIEAADPEFAARKLADWTGVTPPGGEPWSEFTARIDRAIETIRAGAFPALVVAHLAVNAWIAYRLGGTDPLLFRQEYAEINQYEL